MPGHKNGPLFIVPVMFRRDKAPNEEEQRRLDELRARRDGIWDQYLGLLMDRQRLSDGYYDWLEDQEPETLQSALVAERKKNWESRDTAFKKAAEKKLGEHDDLGKQVEELKGSWTKERDAVF
jgi:hypothetical protein